MWEGAACDVLFASKDQSASFTIAAEQKTLQCFLLTHLTLVSRSNCVDRYFQIIIPTVTRKSCVFDS